MKRILLLCLLLPLAFSALWAQKQKNYEVKNFQAIDFAASGQLILQEGNSEGLRIEASEEVDWEDLEVEVRNKSLHIGWKRGNRIFRNRMPEMKYYVTFKKLEALAVSGAAKLLCESTIRADKFVLAASGSFKGELLVEADILSVSISGSGDITVRGKAKDQVLAISGSGKYYAFELDSKSAKVAISGSGTAEIKANDALQVRSSGSGRIRYKGNPSKVDIVNSGSSKVSKEQ